MLPPLSRTALTAALRALEVGEGARELFRDVMVCSGGKMRCEVGYFDGNRSVHRGRYRIPGQGLPKRSNEYVTLCPERLEVL